VGYPDKLRPMVTEYHGDPVAGGTYPAQIWKTFMQSALAREPAEYFPSPEYRQVAPYEVAYRKQRWLLDNGNCRDTKLVVYFVGHGPTEEAPCKPNEVDIPRVVGATLENAKERLLGMPLTPEVITRPAKEGERLDRVVAQYPARGTLSSWEKVRIVIPKALHGRVPNVVGVRVAKAQRRLAAYDLTGVVEAFAGGDLGVVIAQFPGAGRAAGANLTVRLVVGRG
jgi:hypothetical protein